MSTKSINNLFFKNRILAPTRVIVGDEDLFEGSHCANLLSITNEYGYIASACKGGFLVFPTSLLHEQFNDMQLAKDVKKQEILISSRPGVVQISSFSNIKFLSFYHEYLSVVNDTGCQIYHLGSILAKQSDPLASLPDIDQFSWNSNGMFSAITKDGSCNVYKIETGVKLVASVGKAISSCWMGEFLIFVNTKNQVVKHSVDTGRGVLLKIDDIASVYPCDVDTFFVVHLNDDKDVEVVMGDKRLNMKIGFCLDETAPKELCCHSISNWNMYLLSTGIENAVNYLCKENGEWVEAKMFDDINKVTLSQDCLGMVIDYTDTRPFYQKDDDTTLPPTPILTLLSADGMITSFSILYGNKTAPTKKGDKVPLSFQKEIDGFNALDKKAGVKTPQSVGTPKSDSTGTPKFKDRFIEKIATLPKILQEKSVSVAPVEKIVTVSIPPKFVEKTEGDKIAEKLDPEQFKNDFLAKEFAKFRDQYQKVKSFKQKLMDTVDELDSLDLNKMTEEIAKLNVKGPNLVDTINECRSMSSESQIQLQMTEKILYDNDLKRRKWIDLKKSAPLAKEYEEKLKSAQDKISQIQNVVKGLNHPRPKISQKQLEELVWMQSDKAQKQANELKKLETKLKKLKIDTPVVAREKKTGSAEIREFLKNRQSPVITRGSVAPIVIDAVIPSYMARTEVKEKLIQVKLPSEPSTQVRSRQFRPEVVKDIEKEMKFEPVKDKPVEKISFVSSSPKEKEHDDDSRLRFDPKQCEIEMPKTCVAKQQFMIDIILKDANGNVPKNETIVVLATHLSPVDAAVPEKVRPVVDHIGDGMYSAKLTLPRAGEYRVAVAIVIDKKAVYLGNTPISIKVGAPVILNDLGMNIDTPMYTTKDFKFEKPVASSRLDLRTPTPTPDSKKDTFGEFKTPLSTKKSPDSRFDLNTPIASPNSKDIFINYKTADKKEDVVVLPDKKDDVFKFPDNPSEKKGILKKSPQLPAGKDEKDSMQFKSGTPLVKSTSFENLDSTVDLFAQTPTTTKSSLSIFGSHEEVKNPFESKSEKRPLNPVQVPVAMKNMMSLDLSKKTDPPKSSFKEPEQNTFDPSVFSQGTKNDFTTTSWDSDSKSSFGGNDSKSSFGGNDTKSSFGGSFGGSNFDFGKPDEKSDFKSDFSSDSWGKTDSKQDKIETGSGFGESGFGSSSFQMSGNTDSGSGFGSSSWGAQNTQTNTQPGNDTNSSWGNFAQENTGKGFDSFNSGSETNFGTSNPFGAGIGGSSSWEMRK